MIYTIEKVDNHPAYQVHEALFWLINQMKDNEVFEAALFHDDYPIFIDIIIDHETLNELLEDLFEQFHAIDDEDIKNQIIDSFNYWNDIQQRCNAIDQDSILWDEFPDDIKTAFATLYYYLYKQLTNDSVTLLSEEMLRKNHYRNFWNLNGNVCCFCGIEKLDDPEIKTNAYDHYLQINKFPFCGVNYDNIIPMCDKCNQAPSKGNKDVLFSNYENRIRRLAFYPYEVIDEPEISVNIDNIFAGECNIEIDIDGDNPNKIEVWKEIFNIDARFISEVKTNRRNWVGALVNRSNKILENTDELIEEIIHHKNNINDSQRYLNQHLEYAFWNSLLANNNEELELLFEHTNEVRAARNN